MTLKHLSLQQIIPFYISQIGEIPKANNGLGGWPEHFSGVGSQLKCLQEFGPDRKDLV